ncbi:hypothetical protein SLA2020_187040 [Shorea laevis]
MHLRLSKVNVDILSALPEAPQLVSADAHPRALDNWPPVQRTSRLVARTAVDASSRALDNLPFVLRSGPNQPQDQELPFGM